MGLADLGQGDQDVQNAQKAALQEGLQWAIDTFLGTIAYWRGSDALTFNQHLQLDAQNNAKLDQQAGITKFINYFKRTMGDMADIADIDKFYQFSDINEHKIDLSDAEMKPQKFVNPAYLYEKLENNYKSAIQMKILSGMQNTRYIQGLNAQMDVGSMYFEITNLDPSQISIKDGIDINNIIQEYATKIRADYLDENNTWKANIEQTQGDYDTVIDAIKAKIKAETQTNDGMVKALLEKEADATQHRTLQGVIDAIVIDDYSQINTLDNLVDAILAKLYAMDIDNVNTPYSLNNIKDKLKTIKFVDTDYYKISLQQIGNNPNQNQDKKREAELDKIFTFCNDVLLLNMDWNNVLIRLADVNNDASNLTQDILLKSIQYAYPGLQDDHITYYHDEYLTKTELQDATQASNSLEEILKIKTNKQDLDIQTMTAPELLTALSGINDDNIKQYGTTALQMLENAGDYIKTQDAGNNQNIVTSIKAKLITDGTVIEPTVESIANKIATTPNLQNQLSTNDQFSGLFIKKQDAVNNNQIINDIKAKLIHDGTLIEPTVDSIANKIATMQNLQQQLPNNNRFSSLFIKNDTQAIL